MKHHPLIITPHEAAALAAGTLTQIRRPIKPQPPSNTVAVHKSLSGDDWITVFFKENYRLEASSRIKCPWCVGDRLWTRETFVIESNKGVDSADHYPPPFSDGRPTRWAASAECGDYWEQCHYKATDPVPELAYDDCDDPCCRWKPSIHMPRWASRFTLIPKATKVELVQEISEADALACGFRGVNCYRHPALTELVTDDGLLPTEEFCDDWNSRYSKRGLGWDANPWVWVADVEVEK